MNIAAWILVLFAHVGPLGDGNSNALTTAEFQTKEACVAAGTAVKEMVAGTVKKIEFRCVSSK